MIRNVQWPFALVGDRRRRTVGWAIIGGWLLTSRAEVQLSELVQDGYRFVGMTSHLSFPRNDETGDMRDYYGLCEAWCHCFREPDRFLPMQKPRVLISWSDFIDYNRVSPATICLNQEEDSDHYFVYVCNDDSWSKVAKNLSLARRCIPRLCEQLNLTCLVIGLPASVFGPTSGRVQFSPLLPWKSFLGILRRSRFLFVPNLTDPSPRVIGEAMCLEVPVIVNRQILGGWKYVNPFTGVFFTDDDDVVECTRRCFTQPLNPRNWFRANYGPYLSGVKLLRLLRSLDPAIDERSHVLILMSADDT